MEFWARLRRILILCVFMHNTSFLNFKRCILNYTKFQCKPLGNQMKIQNSVRVSVSYLSERNKNPVHALIILRTYFSHREVAMRSKTTDSYVTDSGLLVLGFTTVIIGGANQTHANCILIVWGDSYMLKYTGMCRSNGLVFTKIP